MDTNFNITVLIDNKSMKHLLFHTITAYLNHVHHLMRNKMSFSKTDMEQIIRLLSENLPEFCHQQTLAARFLQISAERMSAHQNKCLREFGINENLWFALLIVYISPRHEILPSRLSDLMDLTRTSATRLSDEMVDRGWVHRSVNEKDRRQIVLKLTPRGESFIRSVQPTIAKKHSEVWSDFSDEEYQYMQKLLDKLLMRLGCSN